MKEYRLHKQCHILLFGFLFSISCNVQNQPHLPEDSTGGPTAQPKTGENAGKTAAYGPQDIVQCALLDRAGNLWFGTTGGEGLFRYDPSAQVGTGGHSFTNYTEKDGLCNNEISCIYEDQAGILWFGTDDGVSRCDPSALSKTGEKPFTCMLIADETLNPSSGIVQGQQKNRSARPFRELDSFSNSVQGPVVTSATVVSSILQDKTGNFWFGTLDRGVYRYDPSVQPSEKAYTNFLSHEVVRCITEDKSGNIWVGSWSNGGVHRYDGSQANHPCIKNSCKHDLRVPQDLKAHNQEIAKSTPNFTKQDGPRDGMISCIFEDKNGNLWFGGRYGRLFRYDGAYKKDKNQAANSFTDFSAQVHRQK